MAPVVPEFTAAEFLEIYESERPSPVLDLPEYIQICARAGNARSDFQGRLSVLQPLPKGSRKSLRQDRRLLINRRSKNSTDVFNGVKKMEIKETIWIAQRDLRALHLKRTEVTRQLTAARHENGLLRQKLRSLENTRLTSFISALDSSRMHPKHGNGASRMHPKHGNVQSEDNGPVKLFITGGFMPYFYGPVLPSPGDANAEEIEIALFMVNG